MIAAAIDKILSLAKPPVVQIGSEMYSTERTLSMIDRERHAETLRVSTLSSMVEYVKEFKETWKELPLLIHVMGPTKAVLMTALDADREREWLMSAEAELNGIPFEKFVDNEKMRIAVQANAVDDTETDKALVLRFMGTVTSGTVKDYSDDGVSQKATVRKGVASKKDDIVPSPCCLRPYRTFVEVEQPASRFIFRMREASGDRVESALFEADGGAWKAEAMRNIKAYLEKELEGTGVVVIS